MKTLILGYGNELRGDDGIGVHVARILSESSPGEDVEVVACGQLTPDLAEAVGRCRRVIFVDASMEDAPGHIACHPLRGMDCGTVSFSHDLDPQSLLVWARELYGSEPEAVLLTMGGECFDLTDRLSPAVMRHLPALVECVRQQIAQSGEWPYEEHQHQG